MVGQEMLSPLAGASNKGDRKLGDDDSKEETGSTSKETGPPGPLLPVDTGEKEEEEVVGTDPLVGEVSGSESRYASPPGFANPLSPEMTTIRFFPPWSSLLGASLFPWSSRVSPKRTLP